MFASHSNAVPLSVTNPSLSRSPPNIEGGTFEPQDTRLYPRVLDEQDLLKTTTFDDPHFAEWVEYTDSKYRQGVDFKVFSYKYFEDPSFAKLDKIDQKGQAHLVSRLVALVAITELWMGFDEVKTSIHQGQGGPWHEMNHYMYALKSLCCKFESYTKVHEFLVDSFGNIKRKLRIIQFGGPVQPSQHPDPNESTLLTTTTFETPHITDWFKVTDHKYRQLHEDFGEINPHYQDFEDQSFVKQQIDKIDQEKQAELVSRLVTMVNITDIWMDYDPAQDSIRRGQGKQLDELNHYLSVLESLCQKFESYKEVHKFLVNSLYRIKKKQKDIQSCLP
ncbi:hypothetical protein H0H93_006319 [Arthromyces matolae]|nr:hypothetical protein H0H93_006319 [Arthromyces matolae]